MKSLKAILFLFLWLFAPSAPVLAAAASEPTAADDFFESNGLGHTGVPIIGYDDKSGWLFGGAGFVYSEIEPGINIGLFGVSNFNNFYSATLNYEQRSQKWLYAFHGLAESAFDNYYGEGDLTSPYDPSFISMGHFETKPMVLYRFLPHFRAGVFDDFRSRIETGAMRNGVALVGGASRLFPDESTNAMGVHVEWDTRDKVINTRKGDFFQINLSYAPGAWTTWPDHSGFIQAQIDVRGFRPLYRHVTLGSRVVAAISYGDPSYLFRYRLGGLDTMRGYLDNRFRGKDFAVLQEEIRWYLVKWFSVNISADLGDIGDGNFHQLKASGQAGIRLGLPPDWVQKMRVDLGYGFDQNTFQIQFGEIF